MDTNKHLFAALIFVALALPARAEVSVGIVRLNDEGGSYLYSSRKIAAGETVYFQFAKEGTPACCQHTAARAARPVTPDDAAVDYDADTRLYRYRLALKSEPDALPFIGAAAIGKALRVKEAGPWTMRVHQPGGVAELRLCTSREGVHVTREGKGGKRRHIYLYLGYDIENPTCSLGSRE
jgi:hypothetical protein